MIKGLLFIFFIILTAAGFYWIKPNSSVKSYSKPVPVAKKAISDTITIAAVGDIMMGSAFPSTANLADDDAKGSFAATEEYLKSADVTFGNLEGVFLNQGNSDKCKTSSTACYAFRMPERYVKNLVQAGFDVMSVANNHSGDFNAAGRKRTTEILDSAKINFAGFTTHPSAIFKKNGIIYGFCAFAPNEGTVSINDLANAKTLISALKRKVDIVIVSFHGGAEGAKYQHVTRKSEFFYTQNRGNVYEFAHAAIDAGADLILGHGPHVTRAVELYKKRFIAYSLGNFCTYGMFNLEGVNGTAPLMQLKISGKGEFISANVISILQRKNQHAVIDPEKNVLNRLRELTTSDFPESKLRILNTGIIIPKE